MKTLLPLSDPTALTQPIIIPPARPLPAWSRQVTITISRTTLAMAVLSVVTACVMLGIVFGTDDDSSPSPLFDPVGVTTAGRTDAREEPWRNPFARRTPVLIEPPRVVPVPSA